MPTPTLVELCTKACIKNIKNLSDVGDFEYWKIRPVLSRVIFPEQLHDIEVASPQILGHDADLWKAFIARDVPDWKRKNYAPEDPTKWYEVYVRYRSEQKQEIERDQARLREAMLGLKREKETHVSKVVEAKHLPRLPKDPRMRPNNGGVPLVGRGRGQGRSASAMSGGSKAMKNSTGILARVRREAKEMSARKRLGMTSQRLNAGASQVLRAPSGMINNYRRAAEPAPKIPSLKRKWGDLDNQHRPITGPSLEEREKKLRALKITHPVEPIVVGPNYDDNSDSDLDSLFGDTKVPSHPLKTNSAQGSQPKSRGSQGKPAAECKPSELISAIISRPKLKQSSPPESPQRSIKPLQSRSPTKSQSPPSRPSAIRGFSRLSPTGQSLPRPIMLIRRKPEVDIFNRGATKKYQAK